MTRHAQRCAQQQSHTVSDRHSGVLARESHRKWQTPSDSRAARTAHLIFPACWTDQPAGARQVVDDEQGPRTRKEYTIARVPVGDGLTGQVVDFLLRPLRGSPGAGSGGAGLGAPATAPLLGVAPDMDAREQICEALVTGVKVCGCGSGVL